MFEAAPARLYKNSVAFVPEGFNDASRSELGGAGSVPWAFGYFMSGLKGEPVASKVKAAPTLHPERLKPQAQFGSPRKDCSLSTSTLPQQRSKAAQMEKGFSNGTVNRRSFIKTGSGCLWSMETLAPAQNRWGSETASGEPHP